MSDAVEAFPLCWPSHTPRCNRPERSRFDTGLADARDGLIKEISLLGGKQAVISTNLELRKDGLPYASRKAPDDSGVAVYFMRKGQQLCFPCDKWDRVQDNLQAVRKTIEAIRGIERWGSEQLLDRAFTGFAALEFKAGREWWEVLGVSQEATADEIRRAYMSARSKSHPDRGGNQDEFNAVQLAYELSRQ